VAQSAYGQRLARSFRMRSPPTLTSHTQAGSTLALTELVHDAPGFGFTAPQAFEDAYLIGLQMRALDRHELWLDGRAVKVTAIAEGSTHFYDLRRNPVAYIEDPFHPLFLYLPRPALCEVAEEVQTASTVELRYDAGVWIRDPVIGHLMSSLLPALRAQQATNALYVDQVLRALLVHLVEQYGGNRVAAPAPRGGLSPWRERRAKELMRERIEHGISLAELADACDLSVGAFSALFKRSTGITPHQWLLQSRVDRAIELMDDERQTLSEIALACGFADQAHFNRAFSARTGVSPGAWRANRAAAHK